MELRSFRILKIPRKIKIFGVLELGSSKFFKSQKKTNIFGAQELQTIENPIEKSGFHC